MRKHVLRNLRSKLARELSRGTVDLRVVGSERDGFVLGGEFRGQFITFGQSFERQKDAVGYGRANFSQSARKLLKKAAA